MTTHERSDESNRTLSVTDEKFLVQVENCTWPLADWHHRQHIKVAYLYLLRYPFDEALTRMCRGIKAYNAAQQIADGPLRGYHETLTQAWMRLVFFTLCEFGSYSVGSEPNAKSSPLSADAFFDEHPELHVTRVLRLFYSRALIMSPQAKAEFVEPDLAPFPVSTKNGWSPIEPK